MSDLVNKTNENIDDVLACFPKLNELSDAQMDAVRGAMLRLTALTTVKNADASIKMYEEAVKSMRPIIRNQMAFRSFVSCLCAVYLTGAIFSRLGESYMLASLVLGITFSVGIFWFVDFFTGKLKDRADAKNKTTE